MSPLRQQISINAMSPVPQAKYVGRKIVDLATAEVHVGHVRMWCLQKDAQRYDRSRTRLCDSPECWHTVAGARSGLRSDHMARAAPSFSQTVARDNTADLLGVHGMRPSTQQYLTQQEEDEPDVSHAPSRIALGASSRFRPLRKFAGPSKRHRLPLEVVMASGMYAAFAPRIW
jgi:hypothetical protein